MRLNVQLDLTLSAYPAKVWVEERPYPNNSIEAAICRRLGEPAVQELLRWERAGGARRTTVGEVGEAVWEVIEGKLSPAEFIGHFGDFFPGSEIPAARARVEVTVLGMFLCLAGALKKRPPAVAFVEGWLLNPLRRFVEGVPEVERLAAALNRLEGVVYGEARDIKAVTLSHALQGIVPVWVPARRGAWPVFKVPDRWPATREEIASYMQKELLRNALARLQRVRPVWTRSGRLRLEPVCLADALIAFLFLGEKEQRPKSLSTEDRRAVENYFRTYHRRGKITLEQYQAAVTAVKDAWEAGERDRAVLREAGWAAAGVPPPQV